MPPRTYTPPAYYALDCDEVSMTGYIEKVSGPEIPIRGKLFPDTKSRIYDPDDYVFPYRMTFLDKCGKPPFDYYSGKSLMSRRLVETLEAAGVDNLQKFEVVMTDKTTGAVNHDFFVVNIVGLVAAADMSKSEAIPLGGGQVFTRLEVDPSKPRGLLMFRLAESLIDVVIHERIAEAVAKGDFRGVTLSRLTPRDESGKDGEAPGDSSS